ncbi:hypothetical protein D3C73_1494780 [compost metagenome]
MSVGSLSKNDCEQICIFEENNNNKTLCLDKAIDKLNNKYSKIAITRASLIKSKEKKDLN